MRTPPGYTLACSRDQWRPWVCDKCGASVADSGIEKHSDWHRALATMIMVTVRDELVRREANADDLLPRTREEISAARDAVRDLARLVNKYNARARARQ